MQKYFRFGKKYKMKADQEMAKFNNIQKFMAEIISVRKVKFVPFGFRAQYAD